MFRFWVFILVLFINLQAKIPKDTLIIAVENEISRINPAYSEDHDVLINLIFSGLVYFDQDMNLKPDLAKSWKISKNGLVYDIFLRDDVFWHDGIKFSAQDVKFSIDAFKNSKNNSPLYVNFDNVKKIQIIDPYHIKITLDKSYPAFLDALSIGILPKHLLENKDLNTAYFNEHPIGTGAYKFVEWKKGEYVKLQANDKFYRAKVKTPKLIIKHIFDPLVASIELKNGTIDAALIDNSLLNIFKNNPKFKILREKSVDYRALMFNLNNEFLKDVRVRKALNYAVDRESIVKNLLHGYGTVAFHPLQNSWANPKHFNFFNYDVLKAEKLLLNAGFTKNKDGIFQKNGKELKFQIYAMSNDPLRVSLAGILQSEFRKIGVLTQVISKPAGSFDYSKADSFVIGWGSPFDPDFHTFRVFESSQDSDLNEQGWNFGHYHNKKVDDFLFKARNTFNINERKKYYKDFIDALYDDPPFIFLVYLDFALVYDAEIKGIESRILGHHGVGFTSNIYDWSKQ